ncbi:MAG: polysaccharide biosynthesis/export family protein [Rhodobacteraceae bacterium]|nr:polysaccharide biosynthesis/export family protein [Paracoccaceae bacterium]
MFLRLRKLPASVFMFMMAIGLFVSADRAAAQDNYVIRPGDTLQIEVLEDPGLNRSVLVLPDGTINFPMAGTVSARGRSVSEVQQNLSTALAPNFAAAPNVYVSVGSLAQSAPRSSSRLMDVYAIGEIERPGRAEVDPGTTLLQFLAEAGGPTVFAAEKRIELHRTDSRTGAVSTYLFDYTMPAGGGGGISGGTRLAPGDVVKVPQRRLFE